MHVSFEFYDVETFAEIKAVIVKRGQIYVFDNSGRTARIIFQDNAFDLIATICRHYVVLLVYRLLWFLAFLFVVDSDVINFCTVRFARIRFIAYFLPTYLVFFKCFRK